MNEENASNLGTSRVRSLAHVRDDAHLNRGVYLLPNLLTTAGLFCGVFSLAQTLEGFYFTAALAILGALLFDILDGRVARITKTTSAFGVEYDSLCDMVCFGAAPALIMYEWALKDLGRFGWISAFVYCVGAALRLARFNTNIDVVDKHYFQGLPSPAAAALVAGVVWVIDDFGIQRAEVIRGIAAAVTLFAGITMVSNVPFYSFKDINLRRSVPFWAVLLIVLAMVLISSNPPMILFLLFVAYSISGYVVWGWKRYRRREGRTP